MASDSKLDEKFNAGTEASAETSQQAVVVDINEQVSCPFLYSSLVQFLYYLILQICLFVANEALPQLRRFLIDSDKIATACNNVIYYIVNPSLRSKSGFVYILLFSVSLNKETD